jgi:hypothetical protein
MKSNEVLTEAIKNSVGVKAIAYEMNISAPLVYKWVQDKDTQGATSNPLDRVMDLHRLTGEDNIIQWVCNSAGGFFVKNVATKGEHGHELFKSTQKILQEFSEMLAAITDSKMDGDISNSEAESIRKEWEDLKSVTEQFVVQCENGDYKAERKV